MSARFFAGGLLTALAVLALGASDAGAATLCVSATISGCSKSISAAVRKASAGDIINVNPGTYREGVVIDKPLSLVGLDVRNTIIEARGRANGIYVDGIDNGGLSQVLVSGFTVKDANFEGILVTNASNVVIRGNIVQGNDLSLDFKAQSCPGLPAFETAEGEDCGEGVHLIGVDHATIVDNTVTHNAGGILLTDETLETHDNLIAGNSVTDNVLDCGITLASHPPASGKGKPRGVNHNTITDNIATGNGVTGQGAGVGLFAFLPSGTVSLNSVIHNELLNNGIGGVVFHAHAPAEDFDGNIVVGNKIAGNGADPDASAGPSGIVVFGVSPITGLIIADNRITDEASDIFISTPAAVEIHDNDLLHANGKAGRHAFGVTNAGSGTVNATANYWDCSDGPGKSDCTKASAGVTTHPFLTLPSQ